MDYTDSGPMSNETLATLASKALEPGQTDRIFTQYEPVFSELCSRWLTQDTTSTRKIAGFARIVPFATHLAELAEHLFLQSVVGGLLDILPPELEEAIALSLSESQLCEHLLGVYRLLAFDNGSFGRFLQPARLQVLLAHSSRPVRYLAVRILCLYLFAADASTEEMVTRYVGKEPIQGEWEGIQIDYWFLSLWEEQRHKKIVHARTKQRSREDGVVSVAPGALSAQCCDIYGVLLPRLSAPSASTTISTLVQTPTTIANLRNVARTLSVSNALLLTGLPGSGKTLLIRHLAMQLGKLNSMVTLHLNEQSDAKLLIGMYTTGSDPGSFEWRPGVLTTAVREGRWVFIEDLDRAPNEILSTFLPLIERGELLIPSRGERIVAARGFKIIASMRSNKNLKGEEVPTKSLIGSRLWSSIRVDSLSLDELRTIVNTRFPRLRGHTEAVISIYSRISSERLSIAHTDQLARSRAVTPRDLFKWCRRMSSLLTDDTSITAQQKDGMFLEAFDTFAGSFQEQQSRLGLLACVAEELHIDSQRRDFLLLSREVSHHLGNTSLQVGRVNLRRKKGLKPSEKVKRRPFSTNGHTLRLLEKLGRAVECKEPLLLVGETGTGKTTCIQYMADQLGRTLVTFNLSQQSESGDLLGGFKPVNVRSLIIPMKDEFDELFEMTFSRRKNDGKFMDLLGKRIARGKWTAVCAQWRDALRLVDSHREKIGMSRQEQPLKKRKLENGVTPFPEARWNKFASDLTILESRLLKASEAFAFAFQEGNIVKAVRNGDWILLDEINLASPDTLEALADLFETDIDPSVLLTETGDTERVVAHPDFRVFAAMNPATDVGKKDLPPGIRSRFTELYVDSPDSDDKSLRSVVETYLGSNEPDSKRTAADVTTLYRAIQDLVRKNLLVDGADQKPHFSLRTLTRTLTYARDMTGLCTRRRALYEGFHMSFCTLLDSKSEKLVAPLIEQHLFSQHKNARSELKKTLQAPGDNQHYVQEGHHWLRQGPVELENQPHYIITPFVQRNLNNLIRAASTRKYPILIQGPTSSGKTSMIEYLAKRTGNHFVRINNHEHTDLQEYLGTYVSSEGGLRFQEGILVKALREGYWIVLDELNLAPTDVLEALNRLLDDNRELLIPETQELVRPHENFMLFATQNPAGLYGGRKILSRAFRNRFLELHFDDIPVEELTDILHRRTAIPESWCKRIVAVYKELSLLRQEERIFEQKSFATLRDLFRWALRQAETVQDLANNGYMLLAERVRKEEERKAVKEIIEKIMSKNGARVQINESSLYSYVDNELKGPPQENGIVWTKSMRRLHTLLVQALRNNEPVLLVGETGCGKTTVCQVLADARGQKLHIVNAHQNTETGDLIGSQRPVRNRAAIEASLHELLKRVFKSSTNAPNDIAVTTLLQQYNSLTSDQLALIEPTIQNEIKELHAKSNALFEWADGSLVTAMKYGQFFLLDEISLADDSVLERLNSVLEPQRTILLAEKGTEDSSIVADPEFQFMATMNPGGDYGKKELSPALRNRFTEIWVPPLSDTEDILQIVQTKLPHPAAPYSNALVSFAQWFTEKYNTSATSTVSIRDMLAWASFIYTGITDVSLPPVSSIVHGASMVYIDTLGANPSAMLAMTADSIESGRQLCLSKLESLLGEKVDASVYNASSVKEEESTLTFGAFSLRKQKCSQADVDFGFNAPTTKKNAMRIARALQLSKPVLLEGNPGVGKTTLIVAMAKSVGVPLTRINLSEQTDLIDLFGSDIPVEGEAAGKFVWQDAPFLKAMKEGTWVLLDEMNLASQSILEGLNACLDHRGEVYISELDQTFKRHPNFRLFAAQNPHHQGGGRKGLPASFVNRFTVVYADIFSPDDLKMICMQIFPDIDYQEMDNLIEFVSKLDNEVAIRHSFGAQGSPWEFNLRDTLRWMHLIKAKDGLLGSGTIRDFLDTVFTLRFRTSADRESVLALYERGTKASLPRSFYHNLSHTSYQVGIGLLDRKTINFPQPRCAEKGLDNVKLPVLESLMISVQQSWPVVLVGEGGSGKSFMLKYLASTLGARLTIFPMNPDIDAMDLVGGYEQVDRSRQLNRVLSQISDLAKQVYMLQATEQPTLTERHIDLFSGLSQLCAATSRLDFQRMSRELKFVQSQVEEPYRTQLSELRDQMETYIDASKTPEGPRFQWVDGVLVNAIEQGHWLILDNANFCSSSVLDRLNSLLEPNGYLIINEHSTDNGEARIVKPHPNFRIFMTMDPKYGELSRAMRNRAVELFLLPRHSQKDDAHVETAPHFEGESALYRFRHMIGAMETPHISENTLDIAMDHLSIDDIVKIDSFRHQLESGLVSHIFSPSNGTSADELEKPRNGALTSAMPLSNPNVPIPGSFRVKDMLQSSNTWSIMTLRGNVYRTHILPKVQAYYEQIHGHNALTLDTNAQSTHPMNNELLYRLDPDNEKVAESVDYSLALYSDIVAMKNQVKAIPMRPRHGALKLFMKQIHSLISCIPKHTIKFIENAFQSERLSTEDTLTQSIVFIWWALVEAIDRSRPDITKLNMLLSLLRDLVGSSHDHNLPIGQLRGVLHSELLAFGQSSTLTSGLSMERMWQVYRPATPTTHELLASMLSLEKIAEKYDHAAYRSSSKLEELAKTRASLSQAISLVASHGIDSQSLLTNVSGLIESLQSIETDADIQKTPEFREFFYLISQKLRIANLEGNETGDRLAVTSMLARQSTKPHRSGASSAAKLQRLIDYADLCESALPVPALTDSSYESLIVALDQKEFTNLAGMDRTRNELTIICEVLISESLTLMKDQVSVLDSYLGELSLSLLAAHSDHFQSNSVELLSSVPGPHIQRLATILKEADTYLKGNNGASMARSQASAETWIKLGLHALLLFTPNIAYDPALKPMIERDFYFYRQSRLHKSHQALVDFERQYTGQSATLRSRKIEGELSDLGKEPPLAPILRPSQSESDKLQGEFNNLLVVIRRIETDGFESLAIANETLLRNLSQISRRLTNDFRSYDDLTTPVVGFLSCLKIGITLLQASQDNGDINDNSIRHIWEMTPFLGSSGWHFDQEKIVSVPTNVLYHLLKALHVEAVIENGHRLGRSTTVELVEPIFDRLYVTWKDTLRVEQEKTAADSSLYSYRDKEEDLDDDEADPELFPDYEREMIQSSHTSDAKESPREIASRLAKLHANIISMQSENPQDSIESMILEASTLIRRAQDVSIVKAITPQEMMPLILLKLDRRSRELDQDEMDPRTYSFYFDHHIAEATKFRLLLDKVVKRFRVIKSVWPEHATLSEVIEHCREALSFKHTDPLAKMITKVEKIHSVVYQWQKLASREFSAASLYDELTSLVVSWRRLELRTWATLFDREQDKCVDEAQSWWFIAYETIVVATRSLDNSIDSVETFTKSLLKTLEGYMGTTSIGQYAHRLDLIQQLKNHLQIVSGDDPTSSAVAVALGNFLVFYSRFRKPIQDTIQTLKKPLEKDIKHAIQLASWKDINIDALRQSAKRSHQKLSKVVRKFRAILRRPASTIVNSEISQGLFTESRDLWNFPIDISKNTIASEVFSVAVPEWNARAPRFRNLSSTLNMMRSLTTVGDSAAAVCEDLEAFLDNMEATSSRLRKETPAILTKENTDQVKHLKTQKRKAFADVLKDLKMMGLRSNIGGDILSQQDASSTVLSRLGSFPLGSIAANANLYLHKTLQIMPKAREVAQEHSPDVTPAEVARSTAFLESLMHMSISQNRSLSDTLSAQSRFEKLITQLDNLWCPSYEVRAEFTHDIPFSELHRKLCWFSTMMKTARSIVEIQSRLGKVDFSPVTSGITDLYRTCTMLKTDCDMRADLPTTLTTTTNDETAANVKSLFMDAKSSFATWSRDYPATEAVLAKVLPYTNMECNSPNRTGSLEEVDSTLSTVQKALLDTANAMLAAVEQIQAADAIPGLSVSTENPGWLTHHNKAFSQTIAALRLPQAVRRVEILLKLTSSRFPEMPSGNPVKVVAAMISSVLPMFQQYNNSCADLLTKYAEFHTITTKMLYQLSKSFVQVGTQGFCTPSEKSDEKGAQNEKLEAGTGLGEGEGAEDISKDIGDDEDLTELAQEPSDKKDKEDIEEEKDGVDMADQEMEGEMGDVEEKGDDDADPSDNENEDIESDVGDVDDLGPSTVDEKMWDEGGNDDDKEKAGEDAKGAENKDEQVAAGDDKSKTEESKEEAEDEVEDDAANEESEAVGKDDVEQMDPHMDETEKLDLPEDLNMDDNKSDAASDGLGDFDEFEDGEEQPDAEGQDDDQPEVDNDMDDGESADGDNEDPTAIPEQTEEDAAADDQQDKTDAEEVDDEQEGPEQQQDELHDLADKNNEHAAQDSADMGAGQDAMDLEDSQQKPSTGAAANQDEGAQGDTSEPDNQQPTESGNEQRTDMLDSAGRGEDDEESAESQAFKKIGDTIERWYKQQREILNPSTERQERREEKEVDMTDADFEHLPDEETKADAQALGTATEEQAKAIDEDLALPSNDAQDQDKKDEYAMDVDDEDKDDAVPQDPETQDPQDRAQDNQTDGRANAFIGESNQPRDLSDDITMADDILADSDSDSSSVSTVDRQLQTTHLTLLRSAADARTLWTTHTTRTQALSQSLTEQLRLILAPTQATKLRGDFRTGKRLNLKRIIPYIASSYKRDKIWLRRSAPSKRAYQIMLALDDSESMSERRTEDLAFETLALVSRSLSMLESGELCVVGFGSDVRVAHAFEQPWSSDAGAEVLRQFGFQQKSTDVRKLVMRSIELFREARLRASGAGAELWQLGLIISDGYHDNHGEIQRLVRQAQEERIMIVFVIVDAVRKTQGGDGQESKDSVLDLRSPEISEDGKVVWKRYMDSFAFRWYVVVRDVAELPAVLSMALRQWFREVVDSS